MNYWKDEYLEHLTESEPFGGFKVLREADQNNANTNAAGSNMAYQNIQTQTEEGGLVEAQFAWRKQVGKSALIKHAGEPSIYYFDLSVKNWRLMIKSQRVAAKTSVSGDTSKFLDKDENDFTKVFKGKYTNADGKEVKFPLKTIYVKEVDQNTPEWKQLKEWGYEASQNVMTDNDWNTVSQELAKKYKKKGAGSEVAKSIAAKLASGSGKVNDWQK